MTKKFHGCGATRSTGNTITWKELGEKRDDNAFVREVMHDSELDVETWEPAFKNMLWLYHHTPEQKRAWRSV